MSRSLHCIWVGNPRTRNLSQLDNDLFGTLSVYDKMKSDDKINYWCLDKHVEHYQQLLKGKNIIVRSIELFVVAKSVYEKSDITNTDQLASQTLELLTRVLASERFQIRDFFTVKEAFSFFILSYFKNSIVFDTNVTATDRDLEFSNFSAFRMVAFRKIVEHYEHADVWLMSSNDVNHAQKALRYFLEQTSKADDDFQPVKPYSDEYKKHMLNIVIEAGLLLHDSKPKPEVVFFEGKRLGEGYPVLVANPKVTKHYRNTHGANRGQIPELHFAIAEGNYREVERLIKQAGKDVNEIIHTQEYKNISPLAVAVFYHQHDIYQLLIDQGADKEINLKRVTSNGEKETHLCAPAPRLGTHRNRNILFSLASLASTVSSMQPLAPPGSLESTGVSSETLSVEM